LLPADRNASIDQVIRLIRLPFFFVVCGAFAAHALAQPRNPQSAGRANSACEVTVVTRSTRPPRPVPASFSYGNARIAVALNPPNGRLVAGRLPNGGYRAEINKDGSIEAKYGWWRSAARPRLRISGQRIDAPAPPLGASIPAGYDRGFQATGIHFPTTGCWRVTGRFGAATLTFTVLVSKSRLRR
jgi:hypothetical protein